MSIFAQMVAVMAEAGQAGLAHSSLAYADPKEVAKQKAGAASCTPCAIAARRERASQMVATSTGAAPPMRARPRKAVPAVGSGRP